MNTFESLLDLPRASRMEQAGQWFIIRCMPDVYSGERFNVGVAGADANGIRHAKVIEEPGRLKCFYGESASNIVALAGVAKMCALNGEPSPSAQIEFTNPLPFYNAELLDFLNAAYAQEVTTALAVKEVPSRERIDDDGALRLVRDSIRMATPDAERILASVPYLSFQTPHGKRSVYAPFITRNGVGTLKSADYSPDTLRTHLMDAVLDMEFAARLGKKESQGLFILRPKLKTEKEAQQIDRALDAVLFRAHPSLHVDIESSVRTLTARVVDWAFAA